MSSICRVHECIPHPSYLPTLGNCLIPHDMSKEGTDNKELDD
jgi:hypothetical protein